MEVVFLDLPTEHLIHINARVHTHYPNILFGFWMCTRFEGKGHTTDSPTSVITSCSLTSLHNEYKITKCCGLLQSLQFIQLDPHYYSQNKLNSFWHDRQQLRCLPALK